MQLTSRARGHGGAAEGSADDDVPELGDASKPAQQRWSGGQPWHWRWRWALLAGVVLFFVVLDKSGGFHEDIWPSLVWSSERFTGRQGGACEAACRRIPGGCRQDVVTGLTSMGRAKKLLIDAGLAPWGWATNICNGMPCGDRPHTEPGVVHSVTAVGLPAMPPSARTRLPTGRGIAPHPEAQLPWPGSDYLEFLLMSGPEGDTSWSFNTWEFTNHRAILYELARSNTSRTAFVDLGTNIGWYLLEAGLLGFDRVGVDMQPACVRVNRCNQELNQVDHNVVVFHAAMNSDPAAGDVPVDGDECGGGGNLHKWRGQHGLENVPSRHVGFLLRDDWVAKAPARGDYDFVVKIDVEGLEGEVIEMLIEGGFLGRIRGLIVEVTPHLWTKENALAMAPFRQLMEGAGLRAIRLPPSACAPFGHCRIAPGPQAVASWGTRPVPVEAARDTCSPTWERAGHAFPPTAFEAFRQQVLTDLASGKSGAATKIINWWFTRLTC